MVDMVRDGVIGKWGRDRVGDGGEGVGEVRRKGGEGVGWVRGRVGGIE